MIKKILGIITINLVLILLVLFLFEFGCAFFSFNHDKNSNISIVEKIKKTIKYSKIHYNAPEKMDYTQSMREYNLKNSHRSKKIILIGCSFTYGDGLNADETFDSILEEKADVSVHNLGLCCASPREMLYILKNKDTEYSILNGSNNAEYVIYTYIPDHKKRLYTDVCQFKYTPHFIIYNDSLTYYKKSRILSQSFANSFKNAFIYEKVAKKNGKANELLFLYIKEINKEIQKNFKNNQGKPTKLVVLVYEDDIGEKWKTLEQFDIIVLNANEITNKNLNYQEFRLPDWHPNKKAWDILVPAIIKEIRL